MGADWSLYDALIEGIPAELTVSELIHGARAYMVSSGEGTGICSNMRETWRQPVMAKKFSGMPLRDLAACVKSWDFEEAGLGLCAINACYNTITRLRARGVAISEAKHTEDRSADPFISRQKEVRGKKVTVIGRFPYITQLLGPVCDMSVIEKFYPADGDFPEEAADYLLPESDYVFISTYTIAEKSLPRFLKLSENAYVSIVGPACPMSPLLFGFGVHCLAGLAVKYPDVARECALGYGGNIHRAGQKISLTAEGR